MRDIKWLKQRDKDLREKHLPKQFDEFKTGMVQSIIATVNEMNGGPVTEGKVLEMLENHRQTSIKADIDVFGKKVDQLVENEFIKVVELLDKQQNQIKDAKEFSENLNETIMKH